jgi:hypothetical protein
MVQTSLLDPTSHAMKFLLEACKHGIFCFNNTLYSFNTQKTIEWLQRNGYIKILVTSDGFQVIGITKKGVTTVNEGFFDCLTKGYLYRIYPLLKIDDKVEVKNTIENNSNYVVSNGPEELPKGIYSTKQINKFTLLLVNEETNKLYRVKMYNAKNDLKLVLHVPFNYQQEFDSRFGIIKTKNIVLQLQKVIKDNLTIIKLISQMRDVFKNTSRIIE